MAMDSNENTLKALMARVAKLEAQSRHWKLAAGVFALLASVVVLTGASRADRIEPGLVRARSVEAREFILKDATGQVHARLSLDQDSKRSSSRGFGHSTEAVLEFYDEQGDVTLSVPAAPGMVPTK
jgi:hypothetical protein